MSVRAIGVLAVLAFALQGTQAAASTLSDAAAALQPGQWTTVNTSNLNRATLDDGAGYHVLYYTEDLVWDPVSRQLLFVGGGHGTDAEFLRYRESTNAWTRTKPGGGAWHSSFSHAYDHNAIIPSLGKFYFRQPAYDPSNFLEVYDIASNSWSRSAPMPYRPGCCGGLEYFPELNGLVLANGDAGVLHYDPAANRWTEISGAHWGDYHNFAEYSPVHKVMIFGGGESSGTSAVFRLNANRSITRLSNAPGHLGTTHSVVTTDPVSGNFLVFLDNAFYEFNPATDNWRRMSAGPPWGGGIWGVVATPISTYGVTAFVRYGGDSSKVYLYRHTAGSGSTPPTVSFSASPTSVAPQGSSTLTWSASNANACTASGGWSGSKPTSGTETRGPITANTTFTLRCTNPQGASATRSVTVNVSSTTPPVPTLTLSANPASVQWGKKSVLSWSAQNATGCVASGAWAGNKPAAGSFTTVSLYQTSSFALECSGPGGTVSRAVNVTVLPRPSISMQLWPAEVTLTADYCTRHGMTPQNCRAIANVRWQSLNATACTASGGWSGSRPLNGQVRLTGIAASTDFRLTCTGPGGSYSRFVHFTVNGSAP
jgi:hypothetical protein